MVTRDDVLHIARLAKLSVGEDELDQLTQDMAEIIAFADTINAAGAPAGGGGNIHGLCNALRDDVVVPSYDREDILRNAHGGEDGYFYVRRNS